MKERVFVYGTLRRGGSNAFRMEGCGFLGKGMVRGRMYRIDWYPGVVLDDWGDEVEGEVYEVDAERLRELDEFEGVSADEGSEYRRVRVRVSRVEGEFSGVWIWEWMGPVEEERRVKGGNWLKME